MSQHQQCKVYVCTYIVWEGGMRAVEVEGRICSGEEACMRRLNVGEVLIRGSWLYCTHLFHHSALHTVTCYFHPYTFNEILLPIRRLTYGLAWWCRAHCYVANIRRIDHEQIHSRIFLLMQDVSAKGLCGQDILHQLLLIPLCICSPSIHPIWASMSCITEVDAVIWSP